MTEENGSGREIRPQGDVTSSQCSLSLRIQDAVGIQIDRNRIKANIASSSRTTPSSNGCIFGHRDRFGAELDVGSWVMMFCRIEI